MSDPLSDLAVAKKRALALVAQESRERLAREAHESFVPAWDDYTHADEREDSPKWSDDQ